MTGLCKPLGKRGNRPVVIVMHCAKGARSVPAEGPCKAASDEAGWEEELLAAEAMALLSAQTGPSSQAAGCDDLAEVCPCQPLALHA